MKRRMSQLILFLVCAACILAAVPAASAEGTNFAALGVFDFALVSGTDKLNLRVGPGTEYQWAGALDEGKWAGIVGESGSWYHVYLPETNQYGYMSKNFLKRAGNITPPGSNTGVVSNPKPTQFLNLRSYPSYDAQVLGIYYNGAAFTLLSTTPDGWYQVQIGGQIGYFRSEYVRLTGSAGTGETAVLHSANGGKVNLRNAPTYAGSAVLGQYAPGTQVIVHLSSPVIGSFWKVSVNGVLGYMDSVFLTKSVTPVNPGPRPATQGTAVVSNPKSTQYLNLRAQASSSSKVIAQYKNGVRFEVIQAGETWTKVYGSASGNIGYFMTKYLKLSNASFIKTIQNNGSYVNLRSSPSKASGRVYVQVPSGASVTVLIPGDEWCKVRYAGTVGYMMTYFLK